MGGYVSAHNWVLICYALWAKMDIWGARYYRVVALGVLLIALAGCGGSSRPAISVSLSPSSSAVIDQSQSIKITATVANDASLKDVTWSLKGPGALTQNVSLTPNVSSATYVSPTSAITAQEQATVTATSVADPTKSTSITITVNPFPQIPIAQTLPNGTVGASYGQQISLTGGTAPFQWSVYNGPVITGWRVGGSVPDGLKLDPTTGMITGTPKAAGTWYFEVTATDARNLVAYDALSIRINPASTAKANPVPFLNQLLVPTAVSPGGLGLTLKVSGSNFVSGATIDFNGSPLTTTFVDSEHLSAAVPATDVVSAKTASITVVNPTPDGGSSNPVYFQVGAHESTVSFANAPGSPLPISEALGVAAADLNQDGKPDLAIAADWDVYVMLGNGDGTFTPASDSPFPVPSPPYNDATSPYTGPAIAVGDFNHSGHPGLAVAMEQNEAAVILLGKGDGTFATSSAAFADSQGMPTSGVETADFNADGNLDLALINEFTGVSPVVLGYGDGAFNSVGDLIIPMFPAGEAVGDFSGNGHLGVAIAGGGTAKYPDSGVTVSVGNGDGTFTDAIGSPIPLGKNLSAIVAADFNGDGKLDLAVTDADTNSVYILLGNGDGSFQTPVTISVGNDPDAIIAGDFNNDGKLDLAVANYDDNTVTLLLGNGDGTFTQAPGSPYPVGVGPVSIVAADFNGDGKLDLAVANLTDGTVSILLQQ